MANGDFDWHKEDEDSIVIRQVEAVAVYLNKEKNIVIRQQSAMGEDDSVIIIPKERGKEVIAALQRTLKDAKT